MQILQLKFHCNKWMLVRNILRSFWDYYETGSCEWSAGRDRKKSPATPDLSVSVLTSKGTDKACLGCLQEDSISATTLSNHKSLYRGLNWIYWCILSRYSQHHIFISRLHPWGSFWNWGGQMECTFQGQDIGGEPPIAQFCLTG